MVLIGRAVSVSGSYNAGMTLFNVVVKNVVTSDWGTGVFMQDVKNSQLEKVTVSSNTGNGISLQAFRKEYH